jgi:hypothetical protein
MFIAPFAHRLGRLGRLGSELTSNFLMFPFSST